MSEQSEAAQTRNELIGTVAGFVCKLVEYPLDTVKVQAQTQVLVLSRFISSLQRPTG
jgi:hypothetical protein